MHLFRCNVAHFCTQQLDKECCIVGVELHCGCYLANAQICGKGIGKTSRTKTETTTPATHVVVSERLESLLRTVPT